MILDVFRKKTAATPKHVIVDCRKRLVKFLRVSQGKKGGSRAQR